MKFQKISLVVCIPCFRLDTIGFASHNNLFYFLQHAWLNSSTTLLKSLRGKVGGGAEFLHAGGVDNRRGCWFQVPGSKFKVRMNS